MFLSKNAVRRLLPEIGETRIETPSYGLGTRAAELKQKPSECTVVMVNRAHLWYKVYFTKLGFYECYKVPRLDAETPKEVF